MYVRTAEALGQVPLLHSSFAETLGQPPLSPESQNFLERVKRSPQDYEAVLLTRALHQDPWRSFLFVTLRVRGSIVNATGSEDENKAMREKILGALKGILEKHVNDKQFQGLLKKENQLARVLTTAVQKRVKELDSKMTFGFATRIPGRCCSELDFWLIKALLQGSQEVGKLFVITELPREIVERVLNSRVPEAHYSKVGPTLFRIAEKRQNEPYFKKQVEDARRGPPPLPEPKHYKVLRRELEAPGRWFVKQVETPLDPFLPR